MTITRYLAFVGPPEQLAALDRHAARFAQGHGLECVLDASGARVFASGGRAIGTGPGGVILGTLFPREPGTAPISALDPATAGRLARDSGALITGHWGAYVAIQAGSGTASLLRAPLGELGCYYWSDGALVIAASDMALLAGWAGQVPAVDWEAVGRHLLASELRTAATCLSGIRELPGGERLTIGAGELRTETLWSPWCFIAPPHALRSYEDAAAALHATATDCVGRWGGRFGRVLVGLSGGLDSSIVAASLAQAHVPFDCVTFVTDDAMGDERPFARAVAAHLGVTLVEVFRELRGIDLSRSNAAHLPRPTGRAFAQESERIGLAAARACGADAIFRGGGGDNVFCYLQSVRPIVDRIRSEGWGSGVLESALDVCRLTGSSFGTVAACTLRQLRRPARYPFPAETSLLARERAAAVEEVPPHRWLEPPPGTLPGKAAHVALLLAMANHMEPLAPELGMPLLSPLMSQPLVELCLGIPSWWWCRGGNNRMVARRAFAGDLPVSVIARRGKGTPDAFAIALFEANRAQLRELLLDGLLARHGLIDAVAVEAALADQRPIAGHGYSRILQLADVEAWARSWTAR
ncbi:asparagine synthase-related protein [Sphingomonas canadensis]|uniref:asparagine synthase (glutamine-hydrolyzing) n=1 Tax=Sphingomonas canadensis TaxID=1219257 RepID=A0ABW3H0U6_9SPHN|nr:asparagine synthetase B family protein [Sphingomonas canadensis]MCW3835024.1 asparagine synthase-related protein [Sphingomonas canadensis]